MTNEQLVAITMIATLVMVLAWEMLWPRRPVGKGNGWRWLNNLSLAALGQLTVQGLKVPVALMTAWLAQYFGTGILSHHPQAWLTAFFVYLLVSDGIGYFMHRAFHKVPWLWRLHMVHHSDTELDFSSAYRHHPLEIFILQLVGVFVVVLLAPPVSVVAAYIVVHTAIQLPDHSNIYLPEKLDRFLRVFIVTPDFHRLHHSSNQRFTDSNYGAIVPWFDYLFRTASDKPFDEHQSMEIGLEYARTPTDARVDQLILMPFKNYRKPTKPSLAEVDESS